MQNNAGADAAAKWELCWQAYSEAVAEKSVYSDQVKRLELAVFEVSRDNRDSKHPPMPLLCEMVSDCVGSSRLAGS